MLSAPALEQTSLKDLVPVPSDSLVYPVPAPEVLATKGEHLVTLTFALLWRSTLVAVLSMSLEQVLPCDSCPPEMPK